MTTPSEDIAEIKAAIEEVERMAKRLFREVRAFHDLLAAKMAANADLLGMSEGEIVALGGGTPKTPPEEE